MICSRPNQAHAEKRGAFPSTSLALQRARGRVDHASVQIDQHVKTILHMTRMCVVHYFMIVNSMVMEWMKLSVSAVQ
jgi:hypothetical protein